MTKTMMTTTEGETERDTGRTAPVGEKEENTESEKQGDTEEQVEVSVVVDKENNKEDNNNNIESTNDQQQASTETPPPVDHFPAANGNAEDAKTSPVVEDAEVSLKERLKAQRRKRTQQQQQQQSSQQSFAQEEEEKTTHVRIDNFQRPLTLRALLQWLGERCGEEVTEERLWVNLIKTHCYVSFDSVERAQRCIAAVHGQRFPETNTQTLVAHFTAVSAKDAPLSTEAALKPGEWRHASSSSSSNKQQQPVQSSSSGAGAKGKEEDAATIAKRESRNAALKRKLSEATEGSTPTANLFKRAAVSAIIHTNTGTGGTAQRPSEKESSSGGNGHTKKRERAVQEKEMKAHSGEEEEDVTLRHTVAQPSISWQPVSDEVAQKRISLFKNRIGGKVVK